jgi:hypothetical protein
VPHPLGAAHLGCMGVVFVDTTLDHSEHQRLADVEASGGVHTIALAVRGCAQLVADRIHGTASQLVGRSELLVTNPSWCPAAGCAA